MIKYCMIVALRRRQKPQTDAMCIKRKVEVIMAAFNAHKYTSG